MSLAYCVKEQKPCVQWVEKYFKDCLCNRKDEFSFAFGLIGLVSWGVAEIPQIFTNFRNKSSHGVSLTFLLTWVAGGLVLLMVVDFEKINGLFLFRDIFNLVGCLLEPSTLPTQYYTALLYTTSTVVLVMQGFYYDHICRWWSNHPQVENEKEPLEPKSSSDSGIPIPAPKATPRREFYYTSARSLSGSDTPPFRTYLRAARSGPSDMELENELSSEDEEAHVVDKSVKQPRRIPRSAGYGTFLTTSLNLPLQTKGLIVAISNRKLLNEGGMEHHVYGQWLGWLMAAIYMGGRIPQIWLNIKRGSVEGLNPLMFMFALVANLTYVLSILVRTIEWDKIKANMPWLLDAAVCVALDLLIILQYIYYRHIRVKRKSNRGQHVDYMDAGKAAKCKQLNESRGK